MLPSFVARNPQRLRASLIYLVGEQSFFDPDSSNRCLV
jgi:hypothetical protein